MTVDKPEHQRFLLQLINAAQIPGAALELATEIKRAVMTATISDPKKVVSLVPPTDTGEESAR